MKMVMVVVPSNNAEPVLDALINAGHSATYAETRGGMLRQSQKSLFIAVKETQLEEVLTIIKEHCRTKVEMRPQTAEDALAVSSTAVTADLGGAIAFVWDIGRIETF